MRKALALIVLFLLSVPVFAQTNGGIPAGGGNSADDTDCAIIVRAIANTGATIAVTTLDLLFTTEGTTADSDVAAASGDCGATPGTLDTGNAACDTIGELCDQINESATWRCAMIDSVRSDSSIRLLDVVETSGNVLNGVCLPWDTSVAFDNTRLLGPKAARNMPFYLNDPAGTTLKPNPFAGIRTRVDECSETSTYGSGTSFFQIIGSTLGLNSTTRVGSETRYTYWNQAGGATTAEKNFDWQPGGIWSDSGERLLARIDNSAAASVINQFCSATSYRP